MNEDSYVRLGGALLFTSGSIFFLLNTIAEAVYPGYSVKTNALSDLGALGQPTELFWNGQLLVSGILGLLAIYFLFFKSSWSTPIKRRNLTATLFLVPPIGVVTVSLFPVNFILVIHSIGALANFVFGGVSAVYAYRLTKPPFRYFSVALGAISLVSISLLGTGTLFGFGLIERMVVYPLVIWDVAFGSYLMAIHSG